MKLNTIDTTKMRNDEHFQFMTEFGEAVTKFGGADGLNIAAQYATFPALYAQEDTALKKIMKSALTAEIQAADFRRDQLLKGMTDTAKAALNHFSDDVQKAAKRLKILFDTYGNVARKPLNEQTSAVYNLLQDLYGTYSADADKAGLTAWMDELQAANNEFARLMRDRFEESAMKTDLVLKDVRVKLDAVYRSIAEKINALMIVDDDKTPYTDFIVYFNKVIHKYASIIAQRYGKKKQSKP